MADSYDPNAYDDLFEEAAALYDLDPRWVKAHALQESTMNPLAVGDSGRSLGLMQLQSAAADETGVEDRLDPRQNIFGGTAYLRRMLDEFNDPGLASMAYNAGANGTFNPDYLRRVSAHYDRLRGEPWRGGDGVRLAAAKGQAAAPVDILAIPPPPAKGEKGDGGKVDILSIPPPPKAAAAPAPSEAAPVLVAPLQGGQAADLAGTEVAPEPSLRNPNGAGWGRTVDSLNAALGQGLIGGVGGLLSGVGREAQDAERSIYAHLLDTYSRIDRGEVVPPTFESLGYWYASPEKRAELKAAARKAAAAPPLVNVTPPITARLGNAPPAPGDDSVPPGVEPLPLDYDGVRLGAADTASMGDMASVDMRKPTTVGPYQVNLAGAAPRPIGLPDMQPPAPTPQDRNTLMQAGEDVSDYSRRTYQVHPDDEGIATGVARMLGGLPVIIGGAAAGGVLGGPPGAVGAGAMIIGSQAYDSMYNNAKAKGATDTQATEAARTSFLTQGALMGLPVARLMNAIPAPLKGAFVDTLMSIGKRGIEFGSFNALAKFADNFVEKTMVDPNHPLMEGTGSSALEGTIAGLVMPIVGMAFRPKAIPKQDPNAPSLKSYLDTLWEGQQSEAGAQRGLPAPEGAARPGEPPPAAEAPPPAPEPPPPPPPPPAEGAAPPAPKGPTTPRGKAAVDAMQAAAPRPRPPVGARPPEAPPAEAAPEGAGPREAPEKEADQGAPPAPTDQPEPPATAESPAPEEAASLPAEWKKNPGGTSFDPTGHTLTIGPYAFEVHRNVGSAGGGVLGNHLYVEWPRGPGFAQNMPIQGANRGELETALRSAIESGRMEWARQPETAAEQPVSIADIPPPPSASKGKAVWPPPIDPARLTELEEQGTTPFGSDPATPEAQRALANATVDGLKHQLRYLHTLDDARDNGETRFEGEAEWQKFLQEYPSERARALAEVRGALDAVANVWGHDGAQAFVDRALRQANIPASVLTDRAEGAPDKRAPEPEAPEGRKDSLTTGETPTARQHPPPREGETFLGENRDGRPLYADADGVRSYLEDGVRVTEPVELRPTRGPNGSVRYEGVRAGGPEFDPVAPEGARAKPEPSAESPQEAPAQPEALTQGPEALTEEPKASSEGAKASSKGPEASTSPGEGWGDANKTFTKEAADAARARLRERLGRLNSGFDPTIVQDGIALAGYHIEAGARKFADYAARMLEDLGEGARPYLRYLYNLVREYPGFDPHGMDNDAAVTAELARMEQGKPERTPRPEADNAVSSPVPPGDAGAGPRGDEATPAGGEAGAVREPEVRGGEDAVRPADRPGAEGEGRPADDASRPGGAGDREGDADRVPAAAGPGDGRAPRRPAAKRPDADVKGTNFSIEPGDLAEGRGPTQKARDNLAAIKLANALTAAGDAATRAQQETLVKYVGWGGLKGAFRDPKTGLFNRDLAQVGSELEQVLTPEEYETAERSIQYAHYTAEPVVRGMWDAMRRLGFEGGTVFEPGMGVGHFLGMMPSDLADNSQYRGVEMDGVSARIARLLYPESGVQHADFRETPLPHGEFDIAIGNPPFARTVIASDPQYANNGFVLHDYFIAKSLDSVRPGGLLAMVTSAGTMNKAGDDARRYFAERANFLGAIRLPGGTFGENANTQVTTDIIFLQRRPEGRVPLDKAGDTSWTETVIRELPDREGNPIEGHVSRYFTEHAEMVLGEEGFFDQTVAGARYGVRPLEGHDLEKDLAAAIDRLPQNVMVERPSAEEQRIRDFDSGQTKDGSFYMKDGRLMQYRGGVGEPVVFRGPGVKGGMTAEDRARVTHLIPIRDALREVYRHDLADNTEEATKARAALNTAYDKFVEKFGPLNKAVIRYERPKAPQMERLRQEMREEMRERGEFFDPGSFDATPLLEAGQTLTQVATAREQARAAALAAGRQWNEGTFEPEEAPDNQIDQRPNMRPFRGDPEAERLRSIEDYNDITGEARKKTIFFEPTVRRELEPKLETAYDGLLWSLNQFGRLDLPRIAERMNRDHHSLLAELGDAVFRVPGAPDTYETAENYLSGDVVSKAKEVEARVRSEPDLQRNLEALRRVRPPLIPPERISYALGMPWIEPSSYQDFAESLGLGRPRFVRIPALGQWRIEESRNASTTGLATWGTNRMNAWRILDHAFNRVQPVVWDQIDRNTRVVNATATEAAVTKVAELQEAFQSWAREGDHGVALSDRYNDQMNRVTPWKGNGDYLKTPGVNIAWKWRPHQKRAIARIIQRGNTYLAHGVGAGKAQPLDAKILTPRGWTRMGALQVGDVVIAGDGSPTRVVGVFPQGEKEIFRVRFSDGSETECCDEHLWLTQTFDERTRASAGRKAGKSWRCALPKVRALADIRSTLLDPRLGSKNHTIPIVGAVQFESTATALDPYLLGVLIGDGSLRQDGVSLSTADDELLNAVRAALPPGCEAVHVGAYDWRLRYNGARMYAAGRGGWLPSNPIITEMRRTGLQGTHSHSKFLPPDYLFNSVEARTSLLQGLMDTDGWVQAAGTSIYFSTASERLADDVTTLVQSLGGTVSRRIKNTAYTHRGLRLAGRPSHVLCLKLPNSVRPFRLSRKAEKVRNKTKYGPVRYVVDVQPVGRKAAQCIAVAHPSHLYVTDDFIVTHNTSEMIGAAMEMKRLGLVNKPMIIVPNHMLRQFTTEWYDLYPTARLSVADETQFEKDVRRQFVANMAQDDLDGVVLTHSAFQKIPISREFNTRMLREQIAELVAAMRSAGNDRTTRAQLQQQMERLREKLSKMVSNTKDQTLTWEETGVDFLFVDEAHYFRKLDFVTQMANLKGITPSGSDMAWDLYTKARYLDTLRPGRSLVLASGTPITNTMGELYSVSRYLQPQALRDRGLSHFDSWAQAFGTTASSLEQQPDGSFKPVTRFNRFLNTPELYAMVSGVMDVVTGEELGTLVNRPKLAGGRRRLVLAERGERLAAYQVELAGRMEAIRKRTGKPQKGDDIMLSVINDGRLAALDMRFIDGPGVSFLSNRREPSKLDLAVDNIHKIWQETQDHQFYDPSTDYQTPAFKGPAAQMVFANFGVNRSGPGDWSAYEHLKRALVAKGIPEDEIAFIKDAKTHIARQRLFNDINLGKKRILIGSTQKMGTGVNAQKRLVAIHNLDPLWFPADDEQRVGRGLRQGNFSRDLHVIDYTTKGTYDATMWGMMAKKGRFVEDFFRGDPSLRDIADIGEASMYEQAAAMTISDPRVIELAEVNDELRRLERQRDAHNSRQNQLRGEAKWLRDQADADDAAAARIDELLPKLKRTRGDEFEMTVGSETFKKRADAAAALRDETKRVVEKAVETANDRPLWLGELGGLPLYVQALFSRDGKLNYVSFSLRLDKDSIRQVSSPRDENSFGGMIQSAETIINGLFDEPAWLRRNAVEKRGKAADLDKVIGQKFPRAAEIAPLKARSEELARAIQAPPPKKETPATEGGPNEEAPWPNVDADEMLGPNAPFFMRRDVPLYSAVERAAADLRQAKGSGEQMLAAIQRTPGVRQEELEWIGLPAWLREQKSVTRDQITEFVRANRVDVQEVTKGFDDAKHQEQLAEIKRLEGEWDQHERRIRELRPRVAQEGLPLFVRPEEQAPHAAPDPGAVQAFIDEANRLTGGHMQIEAYDAAHDVFTIRFKVGDGERTEQVAGYVWGKLLRAAIEPDATRTQWNFDHETGHALRALGLITDKEWAALMDAAKREKWHERYGIDRRYPDAEPWLRDEEAFVEAMADARFRPPPSDSVLARIIAKIKAFFARLRNLLAGRGYQTAEDIFGRIYEGEVGRREPGSEGPMRGPATAEESVKEAADFNRMTFSRRPTDTPERREDMATRVDARARLEAVPRIGRALAAVYDAARTTGQLAERATHELLFPMRLGSPVAQAVAQRFANQLREIGERYGRLDRDWQERFSPMERRHMAHAMTNQSLFEVMLREDLNGMPEEERASYEAEARRLFNADGHGLAGLPTDLRETLEAADEINATVWQMLGDVGLVQPGAQRIPFYFPRQGVLGEEGLPYRLPSSADEVPRADDEESGGRRGERRRATAMEPTGLNLTASGPMRRHWLKWEDTEAAGRARFGENFKLVDDVRMLTHAWARAERAVVGRELVDQIKAYGEESNLEWVREGARPARGQWFTLDHPAMMRWVPKWPQHPDADGKIAPMRDPEGNIIYERQPIHISTDFKGPLQAVLSDAPGMWYKGAMMLKGAAMHAIMWNPLKHLQVEIGRAFPLLPGKIITLEWISQGSREIADRGAMKEWIGRYGISPIGQGWGLDPATVMEQAEAPYGRIPGLVALRQLADNAARTVGRKLGPVAEKIARHPQQELLWNMVYRLQMAIAVTMRDRFMEGGLDRDTASFASAYLANRFAGALPPEHLSKWANQLSNILMFSRSFTLGNLGVGKDAVKGPPQQIVSLIAHELGPEKAAQAAAAIKQAAKGAFIADMGLFYVFNGLMQSGIKYAATLAAGAAALGAAKSMFDDWLEDARIALTEEYDPFRLLPQQWNEEGKTDRIYLYTDATGRGVYVRPSIGKVGEDLVGWGAHPSKMVQNKASPHFKSLVEAILGKDAFGRAIRNPHPHGVGEWAEAIYDSTKHAIVTPFVPDVAGPIGAIANGTAAQDPFGTFLETAFMLSGFGTISHGASPREPGMSGPETGEKYAEMERLDWMRQTVMKKANPYIRRGDLSKASEIIQESRLPEPEKVQMLRRLRPATTLSPTTRRLIESGWDASRTTGARP